MKQHGDPPPCLASELHASRLNLLSEMEAVEAHARHHLPQSGGIRRGTVAREMTLLVEGRRTREKYPSRTDLTARRAYLRRQVFRQSLEFLSRAGSVRLGEPAIELLE